MSTHPHNHASGHACYGAKASDGAATVKDPVCGMSVDPTATAHRASHDGQDYFFCSAGCRVSAASKWSPQVLATRKHFGMHTEKKKPRCRSDNGAFHLIDEVRSGFEPL